MKWLKNLLGGSANKKKEKEEELKLLQRIVEQNTQTMQAMNDTINVLQYKLDSSQNEMAATLQTEMDNYIKTNEQLRIEGEQQKLLELQTSHEKIVSTYLIKYLEEFNLVNNRFSIVNNIKLISRQDDLMFKVIQMIKLGLKKIDYVVIWEGHIIKIEVDNSGDNIFCSVDGGGKVKSNMVGIKVLKKIVQDLHVDIMNFPTAKTYNIYKVEGRTYKYVLARNEKECYYILKDKSMSTIIHEVDQVDNTAFIKSIKSPLVYSMMRD